jgi:hypothetical protein
VSIEISLLREFRKPAAIVEGQVLSCIVNIFGDVLGTARCSFERGWIGSIRRPFMAIYSGSQVIDLVVTSAEP